MNHRRIPTLLLGLLLLGGTRPTWAGTDDLPPLEGPIEMPQDDSRAVAPPGAAPLPEVPRGPIPEVAPSRTSQPADRPEEMMSPAPAPRGRIDWRTQGPPADRPAETTGPAPGPDYFYVPGGYIPDGEELVWTPGFWAETQPGWEWVPARWVRRSDGWAFRQGRWDRVPTTPARATSLVSEPLDVLLPGDGRDRDPVARHTVSRPAADATRFPYGESPGDPRVGPGPSPRPSERVDPVDPRLLLTPNGMSRNGLTAPSSRVAAPSNPPGPPVVGNDSWVVRPWRYEFPPSYPLLGPPYPLGEPLPGGGPYYVEVYRGGRRGPLDRAGSILGGVLGRRR
jgi:hypothetical protein